jgi:8-hydroxy-5-deazaflavin:NADPH oxidoreductase
MNVTIIGKGGMARGISTRLVAGGNVVTLIARDPEKAKEVAAELQAAAKGGATVKTAPWGSPIRDDIVILALPYSAMAEVIRQAHGQLAGKIVVDISNPLNASYDDPATPPGSSGAEEIAKLVPPDARVVKAFNTTFAGTLVNGAVAGQALDVLIAGDDADAKKTMAGLVEAGGMRAIDVGPLKRARQLEGLGLLGITLQFSRGTQFKTGWKLIG